MDATTIAQIVGAIAGGGVLATAVTWVRDRKKLRVAGNVAVRTEDFTVEIADAARLQAKLVYLESIIEGQAKHIDRQQEDIDFANQRNAALRGRVAELEDQVDSLSRKAGELQLQCESLQRQVRMLSDDTAD